MMSVCHRSLRVGKRPRPVTAAAALPSPSFHLVHGHETYTSSSSRHRYYNTRTNQPNISVGRYHVTVAVAPDIRAYQINNLHQRLRYRSSSSSSSGASSSSGNGIKGGAPSAKPANNATAASSSKKQKRRRGPSKSNHSPIAQITKNHPKTTSNANAAAKHLTRKQILRLTPKQRQNLHNQRLEEYKNSRTYLDEARTNVRTNIKYLSETADGNFKKNINTIKRLFNGEEVWKDVEEPLTPKQQQQQQQLQNQHQQGIDWERAPAEIQANLQTNLSTAQNWLHKATDGLIPSSSYVGIHAPKGGGSANETMPTGGSIATRVQQFHEMKQNNTTLVMDNAWIAKNVLIAMMPGFALHLYFWSKQDEMKGHYEEMERREREKILGPDADKAGAGADDDDKASLNANESGQSTSGGMGISSALIPEGGSAWDKLKMTVNDVFLGGAEEKIREQQELQERLQQEEEEGIASDNEQSNSSSDSSSEEDGIKILSHDSETDIATAKGASVVESKNEDATMQMLLARIQALENQISTTNNNDDNNNNVLTEEDIRSQQEEKRRKEHELQYKMKRLRQSPIQNRREDQLAAQWRQEALDKQEQKDGDKDAEEVVTENASPYTVANVANFAISLMKPELESMKKSAMIRMKEVMTVVGFSEEEEENEATVDEPEAEANDSPPSAAENIDTTHAPATNSESLTSEHSQKDVIGSPPVIEAVDVADSQNNLENQDTAQTDPAEQQRNGVIRWVAKVWRGIRNRTSRGGGGSDGNAKDAEGQTDRKEG